MLCMDYQHNSLYVFVRTGNQPSTVTVASGPTLHTCPAVHQLCERRSLKFREAVAKAFDTYSTGYNCCGRGGMSSPALNGYPSFWLQHLHFDVFLSFNYRKRLLHLLNWGPLSKHLSESFPVGGILDPNWIALRITACRLGHALGPMNFLRALCKSQVMRSKQSRQ